MAWLVRLEMILNEHDFNLQLWSFFYVFCPPLSSCTRRLWYFRPLTHGAVFLAWFGARGARDWLYGGRQRAEEAGDEGQAQTAPGAEHWPAVTVTDVVWEAVYVARVTGQLKVDACYTGAQGNDAKCAWKRERQSSEYSSNWSLIHLLCWFWVPVKWKGLH